MEEFSVARARVKYVGLFKLSDYYNLLYDLFISMGYDVEETKYKHKIKPEGDEVEIEWNCYKKADDYTRFRIYVKTLIVGLQKVKAEKGGVTISMEKGDCEVFFTCSLQTDFLNKWEVNPILKFLKGIYDRYLYKDTFETWKRKVFTDMSTVENEIKAFFNMQKFM